MYLWWRLCTLYLHACQVGVTVGDSGLCCCTCVTCFEHKITPLCVNPASFIIGDCQFAHSFIAQLFWPFAWLYSVQCCIASFWVNWGVACLQSGQKLLPCHLLFVIYSVVWCGVNFVKFSEGVCVCCCDHHALGICVDAIHGRLM